MRKYFTADLNKTAWQIKKSQGLTWGESLRLAMKVMDLPSQGVFANTSVFGTWTRASMDLVAGHFWGLSKAYAELGDKGRSIAMHRVSKVMYHALAMCEEVTLTTLSREKFFGESVMAEIVDFFTASAHAGFTPRTVALVEQGAVQYRNNVRHAQWQF